MHISELEALAAFLESDPDRSLDAIVSRKLDEAPSERWDVWLFRQAATRGDLVDSRLHGSAADLIADAVESFRPDDAARGEVSN